MICYRKRGSLRVTDHFDAQFDKTLGVKEHMTNHSAVQTIGDASVKIVGINEVIITYWRRSLNDLVISCTRVFTITKVIFLKKYIDVT